MSPQRKYNFRYRYGIHSFCRPWWDYLSKKDMWICTNVKTFRNEDVVDDYYRKKFTQLELPNVYSNFTYFKESETTFEFFVW